jgi:5-methylcytosine-specific restriction enzyme subunit McrC
MISLNQKFSVYLLIKLKIPIQNIYYLLCYAWDKLEEGKKVNVSQSDYTNAIELYARVLINGCSHLLKRGLEHNYNDITREYTGIKGKIDFNASLNKNLFKQGRSICKFDEYEVNILQNQILKATLKHLTKIKTLDKQIKQEIWFYYLKFSNIDEIDIKPSLFSKVRIHRNNSFYDFLLKISKLIIENSVLDESEGSYNFIEFIGSEKAMASLFEAFVRNFYKKEQQYFTVRREDINWDAMPIGSSSVSYLPKMQTDITLESKNRKIIIETKFYINALNSRYEGDKFHSSNLYQLYSYLRNIETKMTHSKNIKSEGILLYPAVGYHLNENYILGTHKLSVKTVDLSKPWRDIEKQLFEIINIPVSV